ncbi:MAG: hypothetical protein RLZZ626_1225 [Actinomycetota bacterium]|jgi:hypothetical protein
MDVRIGIRESARELNIESDQSAAVIEEAVATAVASDGGILKLTDSKGRTYLVPAASISFVEIGVEETRRVGFVA